MGGKRTARFVDRLDIAESLVRICGLRLRLKLPPPRGLELRLRLCCSTGRREFKETDTSENGTADNIISVISGVIEVSYLPGVVSVDAALSHRHFGSPLFFLARRVLTDRAAIVLAG